MRSHVISCFLLLVIEGFLLVQCSNEPSSNVERQKPREGQANCIVSLPQKASQDCLLIREEELKKQREIFQLTQRPPFPIPLVNMTILQLSAHYQKDPFERSHFLGYVKMLLKNKAFGKKWIAENPKEMTAFREYEDLFRTFRSTLSSDITGRYYGHRAFRDLASALKYQLVTDVERFNDIVKDWRDDGIFAEQRLSGNNPMVLRRVTENSTEVGLSWSELKKTLNPNYNWESSVMKASGNNEPLEEAIRKGNVYALRYEVFDDLVSFADVADQTPGRNLWPLKSPVALFAIKTQKNGKRLRPVAIQLDHKPDAPVFFPSDGDYWTLAKWIVQATDYAHGQMVEHLLKVHLLMEPFCVVLYRHLSSKHPLNQILKYHCRGLLTTNTIGSPSLIKPDGYMDILTAMGHKGTIQLIGRAYEKLTWKDADFHSDMKKRGLDDKKMLPNFPYRDDCGFLLMAIERMVQDYVNNYYRSNDAVKEDNELQAFVNELAINGSGPDGGNGKIKDFPAVLNTREEVIDVVTKMIWVLSVKHSAVNYPSADYGAFTPILPTKIYNDTRIPPGQTSVFNLPNTNISVAQIEVAMNVGLYHYDTLFDYYSELTDPFASNILRFYHDYFKFAITPRLRYRNQRRLKFSRLSYPYMQYPWVPNSIQT